MVTGIESLLIAILIAWLWTGFVAPAFVPNFGVPIVSGWRLARQNRHLYKPYYIWGCGVFAVGLGLFLLFTLTQYLCCMLIATKLPHQGERELAIRLIIWLAMGWLFDLFTVPELAISDFIF
jgi:hypothetical protein